jgi:anti-sigma regulatory factor (Ser/Thr protein kinase)
MPKPSRYAEILNTVTVDVSAHPKDLTRHYADRFSISRVAANRYVRRLEAEGWIARSGPSTHPVFSPGFQRKVSRLFALEGLEEDLAWERDFRPYLTLSPSVQRIAAHGFTEMVNNAVDHSGGTSVFVWIEQTETHLSIIVSDDGIGIFEKITASLGLPDRRQALFELSKGKLTTDPSRHSGEGVFFTSRVFDVFDIEANGLNFNHHDATSHDWLLERPGTSPGGTSVYMRIALDSTRTLNEVYAQFTQAPEDYDFSRTIVPMRLAQWGDEQLVSRSQAKRLIARFERFKVVVLDFEGVQHIGQAFADELFRVYAHQHPAVELTPRNMTNQVERMWLRTRAPGSPGA